MTSGREGRGAGTAGRDRDVDEEEEEVLTTFDENGRPVRTGEAALMREDLRTR